MRLYQNRHCSGTTELGKPLYVGQHRIKSGTQRITVTVAGEPVRAGIDPYHLLYWEDNNDNLAEVKRGPRP